MNGLGSDFLTEITSGTYPGSSGRAGQVRVEVAGLLELSGGALINSKAYASGDAGEVKVAAGSLHLDGTGIDWATGITSETGIGSTGNAGEVTVETSGRIELVGGAKIDSSTYGEGNAGRVAVRAGSLQLATDARIASNTQGQGAAGSVSVTAGELRIDGIGSNWDMGIMSTTAAGGHAGSVSVTAGALHIDGGGRSTFTGITSGTYPQSTGNAGMVSVEVAGLLALTNGGQIDSSAYASGNAGAVRVRAGQLRINGAGSRYFTGITSGTYPGSTGNADQVMVEVAGLLELLDGGQIDSSTSATGHAGSVTVKAGQLRLDGGGASPWRTAITTQAYHNSAGNAGNVTVNTTGLLEILRGATIDSVTLSAGDAGMVDVTADELRIDGAGSELFTGITSQANSEEFGQVGDVTIRARTLSLVNRGQISIGAYQTLPEDRLTEDSHHSILINATELYLNGGIINAQSTGNVPASAIEIHAGDLLLEAGSRITTEAKQTDAGRIRIDGNRLWLTDSLITTSANGATGNGGDITLTPDYLILDGGFIQANTAAQGARGGDILIDTRALIASQGLLEIGGATRQDFATHSGRNIIQAAAPGGEQGTINVTAPDLDLTASLTPLATPFDDPDDLFTDLCRIAIGDQASSLVERGSGGLAPAPDAPGTVSLGGTRLDRILAR